MKAIAEKEVTIQKSEKTSRKLLSKEKMLSILLLVSILVIWDLLCRFGIIHELILPAPTVVLIATVGTINFWFFLYTFRDYLI